ncbi:MULTISPECIES: hypothetical protein [unclassified Ekhidna]|jgi:hypothetical protein|uniref:hypothetical protein n=1 Tax=unclassified Ekhidna TaxID=2632188 RepID=UPI0032DFD99B
MKRHLKSIWFISVLVLTLTGCFEKDVFPDTPKITFEDIVFYDGTNTDSLILTFSFEDGNGDIGINEGSDILPPFHEFDVYIDSRDTLVTESNLNEVVPPIYLAPLITQNFVPIGISGNTLIVDPSENDYPVLAFNRELFSEDVADIPFECPGLANQDQNFLTNTTITSYDFGENSNIIPTTGAQVVNTTIPVSRVESHYNFIIEFQKKVGENYVPLNYQDIFGTELCDIGIFNGRIPVYDPDGKSGTITYSIQSVILRLAFLDDVIRAKFYVYDRAGNKSNEVFTPDFVLSEITQ